MRTVNKSYTAVAAATLLLGVLLGVVWAGPQNSPQAQDITRKVTLTGGYFIPDHDTQYSDNSGGYLKCGTGTCRFYAPVVFPCLPGVIVERIKLHVDNPDTEALAHAWLYRAYPSTGADAQLAHVQSLPIHAGVSTYTSPDINKMVWPAHSAYIHLEIYAGQVYVHGVTVEYHRNI